MSVHGDEHDQHRTLKGRGLRREARAAAQALADCDSHFSRIEADLPVLKWMVGSILAGGALLVVIALVA